MATRRFPKASALNKEPYRLWFEFLKRAKARDMKVHKDYVEWGDTNMGFDRWWTEPVEPQPQCGRRLDAHRHSNSRRC